MSKLVSNEVIEELQESLLNLNNKIHKMCQTLEGEYLKEPTKIMDCSYERESDSDQTKSKPQ